MLVDSALVGIHFATSVQLIIPSQLGGTVAVSSSGMMIMNAVWLHLL
jgi:hypothetical protein